MMPAPTLNETRECVLVTGANGFAGRSVCRLLLKQGWRVRAVVRDSTQADALRNALEAAQNLDVALVPSIGPDTHWQASLRDCKAVVHLAARVHMMRDSAPDPLFEFRRVNREATIQLARDAVAAGVRQFVFTSTVKVHGEDSGSGAFRESDAPAPVDPYAISKFEAEQALLALAQADTLAVTILRSPLMYGPGVRGNFLSLLRAVATGLPLPLGAVANRRSLLYVENFADSIAAALLQPHASNRVFLVSDGEDMSTRELVRRVARALGRPARLLPLPRTLLLLAASCCGKRAAMERLVGNLAVDITSIRSELGWTPPYAVEAGLLATARWYRERGSRAR
jgi:nucleoside-diphosphate-sugar epimerase